MCFPTKTPARRANWLTSKTATTSGKEIAEWVMNHASSLNLKYVIWGQRIWQPSQDSVKSWSSWKEMEDRGDITANHWYAILVLLRFP